MESNAYAHLYEIARHLNQEFSLTAALQKSLEKTVELFELETGWIWLVQQDSKSVYLAASYNLPPALSKHPERLSGWCYCINKYLSDDMEEATNVSEITCTRLKDISSGTRGLQFHATIPIFNENEKVGLMNLVSKQSQQLEQKQLSIMNTISELIGIAVQRTRLYETRIPGSMDEVHTVMQRVLEPRIDNLLVKLDAVASLDLKKHSQRALDEIKESLDQAKELKSQVQALLIESDKHLEIDHKVPSFHYPTSPLTTRETEVLQLVKNGHTNRQIADRLFIAERTVKFHLTSILSKLFAKTRTEAVNTAMKRGILGI